MWKDNKAVALVNTVSNPNKASSVPCHNKDGFRRQVSWPKSIELYNKYMGVSICLILVEKHTLRAEYQRNVHLPSYRLQQAVYESAISPIHNKAVCARKGEEQCFVAMIVILPIQSLSVQQIASVFITPRQISATNDPHDELQPYDSDVFAAEGM